MRNVALDVGARKIACCEVKDGQVVARATVSKLHELDDLIGPKTEAARVLFEAGRTAWWIHDVLRSYGHQPIILDTTRAKQIGIGQHGRKTDRIDAEVLARALEDNRFAAAHVLTEHRRELRFELGVRRMLVDARAAMISQARQLAAAVSDRIPTCSPEAFVALVKRTALCEQTRNLIEPLVATLEALDAQIATVDAKLAVLSEKEPVVRLLKTAPGVGPVVAAAFVSVIDDAKRFGRAHHVESYIGLVPGEDSSGGRRRIGAITKQGNTYLRALLVQAAWTILRGNKHDPLAAWGQAVSKRRGKRIAAVAVARRLVGVLWSMWRNDEVYDADHRTRSKKTREELERARRTALQRADRKGRPEQRPNRAQNKEVQVHAEEQRTSQIQAARMS